MSYFSELGYFGLLLSAFLSATILPLSSEAVFTVLLLSNFSPGYLIAVASFGNSLGAVVNYALGYWLSLAPIQRWLKRSEKALNRGQAQLKRYGMYALLFAWLPIIGDPITVAAGILRIRFIWFVLLVSVGKSLRYSVLAYFVLLNHSSALGG